MNIKAEDRISMRILEDGTISVSTDAISAENHVQAEELINSTFEELGGERQVVQRKPHLHPHGHTHRHVHQGVKA